VQQNDCGTIGGAGFGISDIQDAGIDLLQRAERRVRPRLDRSRIRGPCRAGLCVRQTAQHELSGGDAHRRGAKKAASILVD
jgi:hypothetical protein